MDNQSENYTILQGVLSRLISIENQLQANTSCPEIRREWIPRKEVMEFLGFKDTRMSYIINKYNLYTSKIGAKKFINAKSLKDLLDNESKFGDK